MTISGIESSDTPTATTQWVEFQGGAIRPQAVTVVNALPQINTRVVQVLDINTGSNSNPVNVRYLTALLDINNNTNVTFNNLTFYALNDPSRSVGGTALSDIVASNGSPVTDPLIARSFTPTHAMYASGWGGFVVPNNSHLSFLTRDEATTVKTQLATLGVPNNVEPLQYGFIARNARGGLTLDQKRILGGVGCTPLNSGCDRGYMAVAYAYPRTMARTQSPDTFTLLFAVGHDDNISFSQSLEEQKALTVTGLNFSVANIPAAQSVRTLTGTTYAGDNHLPLCRIVTAGSIASPLAWLGSLPAGQTSCAVLPPRTFTSSNLTPTSVQLNWAGPVGATSYTLERGLGSAPTSWTPVSLGAGATSVGDTGLSAATTYTYRLRANSSEGSSAWVSLSITTSTGLPAAPTNFSSSSLGYSSVTLSWTGAVGATSYTLERGFGASPSNWFAVATTSNTTLTLSDLAPNTAYSFRLRASNAFGSSGWVSTSLTTPAVTPASCSQSVPTDNSSLVGYSDKMSYFPGDTISLRVNAPTGLFALAVYREGSTPAINTLSQLKLYVDNLPGTAQPMSTPKSYEGVNWTTTYQLVIPNDWPSGLYNFRLIERIPSAGSVALCNSIPVIVKRSVNAPTPRPRIVVLGSNYTWQAYNLWGGGSFYNCSSNTCNGNNWAPIVSSHRPMPNSLAYTPSNEPYAFGLYTILRWLELQGFAYDVISDTDLDRDPNALNGYRVLILDRHSEYVTTSMRDSVDTFLQAGNYIANFGANQLYWKVVTRGDQIEARKDFANHTLSSTVDPGGLWRTLGRPESAVLGVEFTSFDIATYGPFVVQNASHWAMAGTGLVNGNSFGATTNAGRGCSGWETDKMTSFSPANTQLIARGTNPYAPGNTTGVTGAFMVSFAHPGGGEVFSGGSLSLVSCAQTDPTVSRIMRNVLTRFVGP